eukprot:753248-Hanusia_phi.AAC.3
MSSNICIPRASKNATLLECSRRSPCALLELLPPCLHLPPHLENRQDGEVAESFMAVLMSRSASGPPRRTSNTSRCTSTRTKSMSLRTISSLAG